MDERTKYYWKNVVYYFLKIAGLTFLLSFLTGDFFEALEFIGLMAIVLLGLMNATNLMDTAYPKKNY